MNYLAFSKERKINIIDNRFMRTEMLIGKEAFDKLRSAKVAIFGLGGVGSFAAEAIARAGVGEIDLFDGDTVDITNINRQLVALDDTLGRAKTEVMKERIAKINKNAKVSSNRVFFDTVTCDNYDFHGYSYIIDAIDTVSSKLLIIKKAFDAGVPIISSMGTANKLNPCDLEVRDIYETENCPLARVMRRELRKMKIDRLKVVCSKESPKFTPNLCDESGKRINSSISFVPPVAGFILASEVVKDIINKKEV